MCFCCIKCIFSELDLEADDDVLALIDDDVSPTDKDIRCVLKKVASYMQIAEKTTVHIVPKAITYHVIREVEKFINTDLLVEIVNDIDAHEVSFFIVYFLWHFNTLKY